MQEEFQLKIFLDSETEEETKKKICMNCQYSYPHEYPEAERREWECHFVKIIMDLVDGKFKMGFATVSPYASCSEFVQKQSMEEEQ